MSTKVQVLDDDVEVLESGGGGLVLSAMERGQIDIQISTAKQYPRKLSKVMADAMDLIALDQEAAGECWYTLKKGNTVIEGPSTRLAEIVANAWTNIRIDQGFVGEDDHFTTAYSTFFDLERNYAVRIQAKRRITDKHGNRFKDDVIQSTANAAGSIAFRNSVFRGVPGIIVRRLWTYAQEVHLGEEMSLPDRIEAMVDYYSETMEVTEEELWTHIGVDGRDDVTLKHVLYLKGIANAIGDNRTTVEETFRSTGETVSAQDPKTKQLQEEILGSGAGGGAEDDSGSKAKGKKADKPVAPAGDSAEAQPAQQKEVKKAAPKKKATRRKKAAEPEPEPEAAEEPAPEPEEEEPAEDEPDGEPDPEEPEPDEGAEKADELRAGMSGGERKVYDELMKLLAHEAITDQVREVVTHRLKTYSIEKMQKDADTLRGIIESA